MISDQIALHSVQLPLLIFQKNWDAFNLVQKFVAFSFVAGMAFFISSFLSSEESSQNLLFVTVHGKTYLNAYPLDGQKR